MNSTHHHRFYSEIVAEPKAINDLVPITYDAMGAALFIAVVLVWYAMGIFCMLGLQIRARSETIEEFTRRRAKFFIQTIRDQTQTKQILEELVNRERRAKLWQIYWGSATTANITDQEQLHRAEITRIRNIKKQLELINRNQIIMNDTFVSPIIDHVIRPAPSDSQSGSLLTSTTVV